MGETCWPYRPTQFALLQRAQPDYDRGGGFPQSKLLEQIDDARSGTNSWVDGAGEGSDFPLQNCRSHLLGNEGTTAAGRRDRRLYPRPRGRSRMLTKRGARICRTVCSCLVARGPDDHRALRRRLFEMLTDERYRDDLELNLIGKRSADALTCWSAIHRLLRRHPPRDQRRQAVPTDNPLLPTINICRWISR